MANAINAYLGLKIRVVYGDGLGYFNLRFILTEFAKPNLSLIYICISEKFKPRVSVQKNSLNLWVRMKAILLNHLSTRKKSEMQYLSVQNSVLRYCFVINHVVTDLFRNKRGSYFWLYDSILYFFLEFSIENTIDQYWHLQSYWQNLTFR